jgi:CBS domain containing-hemolysin-like protein
MDSDGSSSRRPRNGGAEPHFSWKHSIGEWFRTLRRGRNGEASLRESLEELIEEHDAGPAEASAEEYSMLRNILRLNERRVDDAMVPRADIVAIPVDAPIDDVIKIFGEAGHSRLPLYRETPDDIFGMLHIKDLMGEWGSKSDVTLEALSREVLFVPPSMPVLDLLKQMQATRQHMAIVVDEYGGTDGLVTIEDLIEEIVGEIEDEHDQEEGPQIVEGADGTLAVDARAPVEELEALLGCDLLPEEEDEYVDTVGGLLFSLLGRVPRRGEIIRHPDGVEFEVTEADPRRIKRMRIRRSAPAAADG